ncbi:MAG: SDR family oxidoreductase [Novosphingobium sp.]
MATSQDSGPATTTAGLLEGKAVLITGAGAGIGRAIALAMAEQGASVLVNDHGTDVEGNGSDASLARQVADAIGARGGIAKANHGDVSSRDDAEAMVAEAIEHFGRLDVVINNAGILRDRIFHKMSAEDWDRVVNTHLTGTFQVSRAAAPHFRQQEAGAYIHMTSVSGLIGGLAHANYGAAKLGVVGLSRAIALDMARFNVRSNCIAPTAFTRMFETTPQLARDRDPAWIERSANTRGEQIAPLAIYLASDLSQSISGQVFGARGNEIFLYNQPRPIGWLHRDEGWNPATIQQVMATDWADLLTPLERHQDVLASPKQ